MSNQLALARLQQERADFRRARPFGFAAKPTTREDGSVDLFEWHCIVPGKEKTLCEGAKFPCTIKFSSNYPSKPPQVNMPAGFFHVNICPRSGAVCLSVLKEEVPDHLRVNDHKVPGWSPSITVSQVDLTELLQSLQELLHNPNFGSVLGQEAYRIKSQYGRSEYDRRTREQALKYADDE